MKQLKFALFVLFGLFVFSGSLLAQSEKVVIYNDYNYQGASTALDSSWSGGGAYDKNIRSIQVPKGYRVTLYTEKNYKGTETRLTENWNPGAGAWWTTRVRSIRIDRAQIQPPIEPSNPKSFPVIYAQADFQGAAEAIENGYAGRSDWEGSPHRIRSIRVSEGLYLVLYSKRDFKGKSYNLDSDCTPQQGDWWNGRIRSIKVYKGTPPKQPR